MRKKISLIIAITISLIILAITITLLNKTTKIQKNINKILQQHNTNLSVGITIKSLDDNKIIYQKNAHRLFMPASTTKILPAAAALIFLGPDYRFQTKIFRQKNNIYFYFSGDPSLSKENLNNLIKQLKLLGIKKIEGDIYIDDAIFDDQPLAIGWVWDDLDYCCAAPITALMIDKNCLAFKLDAAINSLKTILTPNQTKHISIDNSINIGIPNPHDDKCLIDIQRSNNNTYQLSGCIKKPRPLNLAISNIRKYASDIILQQLKDNNIELVGTIKFKKITENNLKVLAEHQSAPLAEIIKPILKDSDNNFANALYRKLGYEFFKKPSTWTNSALAIKNILQNAGAINPKELYLEDGSGVSRYNLVTPDFLTATLSLVYNNPRAQQPFIDALADPGTNGTLKERMVDLKNRVFAKTGEMTDASALAGYIKTKTKGTVAFTIIINSFIGSTAQAKKIQDEICKTLSDL